jgi:L-2-hydroxycarboxylate dehydrogenase (NAD+)
VKFAPDRLERFASDVLEALDALPEHAEITARRLVEADLRGRDGHGLIRLPQYVPRIEAGGINLRPTISVTRDMPVSALIDGDNALGQVVMTRAVETAIEKAAAAGMAWVGTVRSNHAGAGGVYTELAVSRGLIAVYTAVASANVMPPWGGRDRILGTNPIAIAIPTADEPTFSLDIATTVASHGTIKVVAEAGKSMPIGWVIDSSGQPITDPHRANDGFLVPIGGYKGSGLNMALGFLAGVLNGAAFGADVIDHREVPDKAANTGQALFVMRPDLFMDHDAFLAAMDAHIRELRASGDDIHIPGDRAARLMAEQEESGIPIPDTLLERLQALGERFSLADTLEES